MSDVSKIRVTLDPNIAELLAQLASGYRQFHDALVAANRHGIPNAQDVIAVSDAFQRTAGDLLAGGFGSGAVAVAK